MSEEKEAVLYLRALADELASISGRCSLEADRVALIKAATVIRAFAPAKRS